MYVVETECQLLRVGKAALAKWVKKIYSLQFSRILRLIYYPIQTKTSKIVIPTHDARCNFGRNSECQLLHGIRNDGSLQNGSKKFSISLQFSRMFKSIYYPIWNSKTSKCISDAVSRLVFLCPNQRLLLKTNEESATGLDLSIFVVVLLPTYLANFEAFFWRFL